MMGNGIDFTREELEELRRCSRNLQRVAAIMEAKFGENDGPGLVARGFEAILMEYFNDNTTVSEKEQIERLMINEDPLTPVDASEEEAAMHGGGAMPERWQCNCGSGLAKRELKDARGIFCTFVCDKCEAEKRTEFSPDIFTNPSYEHDEPIED